MNRKTGILATIGLALLLSGCNWRLMNPAGYVAHEQRTLILICIGVMLCVVIPVMIATVVFAFKYHESKKDAEYLPDWGHSNKVEFFMWSIPVVIVIVLAGLTAYYTFKLEPSRPLPQDVVENKAPPLQIDAVALDWKWLFMYPAYGVGSINEIYAPAGRQVFLQLSASHSVNAFWVPRLGTVLYAMPQMNAKLHLYSNQQGVFDGMSANYSGDGFADMRFKWHSVTQQEFDDWISKLKREGQPLTDEGYLELAKAPAMGDVAAKNADSRIRYFSNLAPELYYRIVNNCVAGNRECNERLMWRDAAQTLWGQLCSVFNADYQYKH